MFANVLATQKVVTPPAIKKTKVEPWSKVHVCKLGPKKTTCQSQTRQRPISGCHGGLWPHTPTFSEPRSDDLETKLTLSGAHPYTDTLKFSFERIGKIHEGFFFL